MKLGIKDICILALFGAMLFAVQVVFAVLPNIEGVSLLILLVTLCYSWRAFFPITVFILLEGITYGFGLWWFFYLYVWFILMALVLALKPLCGKSSWAWALVLGAFGLFFGFFDSLLYLFMGGVGTFLARWASGLLFDVLHCVGNFVITLVLFSPLYKLLQRLTSRPKTPIIEG